MAKAPAADSLDANSGAMARIARVVVPNFSHHVVQRGVRRMDVFFSADDR
jgi:hypothetical protein